MAQSEKKKYIKKCSAETPANPNQKINDVSAIGLRRVTREQTKQTDKQRRYKHERTTYEMRKTQAVKN